MKYWVGILCLLMLMSGVGTTGAQDPVMEWHIPRIECGGDWCDKRYAVDAQKNLYVTVFRQQPAPQMALYVFHFGTDQVDVYDLEPVYPRSFGSLYPVPIGDNQVIMLHTQLNYGTDYPLTLFNLQTQTVTELYKGLKFASCDYFAPLLGFTSGLYSVGGDKVVFCSGLGDLYIRLAHLEGEYLVIEASLKIEGQVYGEGVPPPPWRFMTGGMNGKIYIAPGSQDPILQQVAPQYSETYDLTDYLLLRYDPSTQLWDTIYIEASFERWNSMNIHSFSPLVGVDPNGNLYFLNTEVSNTEATNHPLFTTDFVKYNPQGEKVWHLTEADFGGRTFHPILVGDDEFIFVFSEGDLEYMHYQGY